MSPDMVISQSIGHEALRLPLSTAQRGLWVGQKIGPADAVFNIAEAIEIRCKLEPDLFLHALRLVSHDVETVRVRVFDDLTDPHQTILPEFTDEFRFIDISEQSDPTSFAMRWMEDELKRPVDFTIDPLWVCVLFKIADARFIWYHRSHHIIMDGFTGGLVAQRVAETYSALARGTLPPPCLFGPLSTLIEHEAAYRASERHQRDRTFWNQKMANLPEPVSLARRRMPSTGGLLRATAYLSGPETDRLRNSVKGMNVSLPQVLIALVAAYYHRVTGADDLVFGLPVTARVSGPLRRAPGMLANAVPIRAQFTDDTTVEALFLQIARLVREALRHQQYRYEDLRRDLGLMTQSRQIAWLGVNIEPFDYVLDFDGTRAITHNLSNGSVEDLTVFIYDRSDDQGLRIDFDANPALYTLEELQQHQRRLLRLMSAATRDLSATIGALDILDDAERQLLLLGWNRTTELTPVPGIVELFRRQAALTPDAIAILPDGKSEHALRYAGLDVWSDRIAAMLLHEGIKPGNLVAVALPRDASLPASLLGILKAGAAYMPLDANGPSARLATMLEDARPVAIITTREYAARVTHEHAARMTQENAARVATAAIPCLFLDSLPPGAPATLPPAPRPDDAAYVLYTSGSTGRPKGVQILHRNLSNFIEAMRCELVPQASDRLLSVTTATFDIFGLELYLPLAIGAATVLASDATARDPVALGQLVRDAGITILQATPSLWRGLLASRHADFSAVHALVGGEALPPDLAQTLLLRAKRATNLYGPTETTIWSSCATLQPDDLDPPPIGRPIRNTAFHILDRRMQPVPAGVSGRLFIGGAGVAKGYWNNPALTAERFIDAPPVAEMGRIYDSGDLARWRPDGTLEFLGRGDQQLKLHGFRIEPGEIETHLAAHPDISHAVVVLYEATLLGYLVPHGNIRPDEASLRLHLSGRVPDHMLPKHFVWLDALPLTASGKLDREALPAPKAPSAPTATHIAPRTPTERALVTLWQDVLGVKDIGVNDNFFDLGGDSLTGADLFVRITEQFERQIPFGSLFRAATVAGLAALLDEGTHHDPLDTLIGLRRTGGSEPLFCVHPILGLGWPYASLLRHLDASHPVYALQSSGLRAGQNLPDSIDDIAEEYAAEIRAVQPSGPYRLLGWSLGGLIAHALAARLRRDGDTVSFLGLIDCYPFIAGDGAASMTQAQEVGVARAFLGLHDDNDHGQPTTMPELATFLWRAYHLESQPVVKLVTDRDPDFIARLTSVVRNNLALARLHRPQPVDVDTVFFNALHRTGTALEGVIDYHPRAWRNFVSGSLHVHDMECHHQDVLMPEGAAQIAGIINSRLGANAKDPLPRRAYA